MATIRDNILILESEDIKEISFVEGSLTVTKGQPSNPKVEVKVDDEYVVIHVQSGRKKSREVAEKFISSTLQRRVTQGNVTAPSELNFMFSVDVVWKNGEKQTLRFAQGSNFARNNWWIGGDLDGLEIDSSTPSDTSLIDSVTDGVHPVLRPIVTILGKTAFKELTRAVNVFQIEKKQ